MDLELGGRRALVTGSNRGTGLAIAAALSREGARVLLHGPSQEEAESAARALAADGVVVDTVSGDIATDAGADEVARGVAELVGGVDILVNNFGRPAGGKWSSAAAQDWLDIYEVNTLSAVRMIRHLVPGMKERCWGRVIQIATIGVTRPGPNMPHYYASKAALANLTLSLAKDVAGTGVTVNTVSPGLIKTAEVEQYFRYLAQKRGWGDDWDAIEAAGVKELMQNPLGRMARPDEVADVVVFVASERARFLNGQHLRVDGGASETL